MRLQLAGRTWYRSRPLKADSHIACRAHSVPIPCLCRAHSVPIPCLCRAHAAPMPPHTAPTPFPCHAVSLRVYNVSFPFDLHSAAVSDSHLPCPCHAHAILRPCRSSQGHGTARLSRDGLWATCPRSASSGYHTESHEGCCQKDTNLRCRWPV